MIASNYRACFEKPKTGEDKKGSKGLLKPINQEINPTLNDPLDCRVHIIWGKILMKKGGLRANSVHFAKCQYLPV